MDKYSTMSASELITLGSFDCSCGRTHSTNTKHCIIESGAIKHLPALLDELHSRKPFILSGEKSFAAAGEAVLNVLKENNIEFSKYIFPHSPVVPNEKCVGSAIMHFDPSCDVVISIGSGVINDIGKILANVSSKKYIIVATAPSMDGFASATSSMEIDGLKVSLGSTSAWAVVGDLDVLKNAPLHMLKSGVGDMLAKYISLVEWRIAEILVGEYRCPTIDAMVDCALKKVVSASQSLLDRDENAVESVMDGMVLAGMAMDYAGLSRPASGMEHYFSHIIDMRALAFDECRADLHGIQCGFSTLISLKLYEYIRNIVPDKEKALKYAASFDKDEWNRKLVDFIGEGAYAVIAKEKQEGKYNLTKHARRLDIIIERWDEIITIIDTLPSYGDVYSLMKSVDAPTDPYYLGYTDEDIKKVLMMTKDIRDKYIGTRLLWDLGELENAADFLVNSEKHLT